jgi:hypothetical protein
MTRDDTQFSEMVSDTRERPAAKDKTKELVNFQAKIIPLLFVAIQMKWWNNFCLKELYQLKIVSVLCYPRVMQLGTILS